MQLQYKKLLQEKAYINGEWQATDKTFSVRNPYDNSLLAQVADCGKSETQAAIEAASEAFETWKNYTASKRARLLKKWHSLILKHVDDLAYILTVEQGKPLAEAKGEIKYGASFVEWFAEEAKRTYGDVIPPFMSSVRITTIKQPVGVVGAITPWNFPNAMITRKVAPALAAGCTVVIKPSEETPLSALALAVLAEEAGFPAGVFNVVTTNDAATVGETLTASSLVRKLSFTGSTAVGKLLMRQCADTVKKISLELGGNAPFIVFDDADLDAAVKGAMNAKYRNAGQTCICANRLYIQDGIYDAFVERFTDKVAELKVGNGLEKGTNIGPLINRKAVEKIERLVQDALEGGAQQAQPKEVDQQLCSPTILTDVKSTMDIHQEEIFGPIAAIYRFSTEAEVLELANATNYGLAAYFYGNNYAQIWRVAEALEYGMVGINTASISSTVAPFGGVKESGIGREGSKYGIEEFLEIKYMCWGGVQ